LYRCRLLIARSLHEIPQPFFPLPSFSALAVPRRFNFNSVVLSEDAELDLNVGGGEAEKKTAKIFFHEVEFDLPPPPPAPPATSNVIGRAARRLFRRLTSAVGGHYGQRSRRDSSASSLESAPAAIVGLSLSELPEDREVFSKSADFLDDDINSVSVQQHGKSPVCASMSMPYFGGRGDRSSSSSSCNQLRRKSLSGFFQKISPSFFGDANNNHNNSKHTKRRLSLSFDRGPAETSSPQLRRKTTEVAPRRMARSEKDLSYKETGWHRSKSVNGMKVTISPHVELPETPMARHRHGGALCGVASIWSARLRRKEDSQNELKRRVSSVSTDSFEQYLFEPRRLSPIPVPPPVAPFSPVYEAPYSGHLRNERLVTANGARRNRTITNARAFINIVKKERAVAY